MGIASKQVDQANSKYKQMFKLPSYFRKFHNLYMPLGQYVASIKEDQVRARAEWACDHI